MNNLVGEALYVWLSCREPINFEGIPLLSGLSRLGLIVCNPMTIRWGRFLHKVE